MLLYFDPIVLEHQTGSHPECSARLHPVVKWINDCGREEWELQPSWTPVTTERLSGVHTLNYIRTVQEVAAKGGGFIEGDTVVSPVSYDVAKVAAGAVCDAVRRVFNDEDKRAFCLIRPPGHHALTGNAMGFCLFNNVAIGSRVAINELGLDRVLIVDWDVHHGNGTQATFWEDSQVGFFSIHRWPFYPGTGNTDETGSGPGLGMTRNLPTSYGTSRKDYLSRFRHELEAFAAIVKPDLVLISAGFDAHRKDPIGSLGLESEDFQPLTRAVVEVADAYAAGRVISVLEGGYHPEALSECVQVHVGELGCDGRSTPRRKRPARKS